MYQKFRDLSFVRKLNLVFLFLVIFPLIVMSVLVSEVMSVELKRQGEKSSEQYLKQGIESLENNLRELDNILYSAVSLAEMQDILKTEELDETKEEFVMSNLRSIQNARKDVRQVWIKTKNGQTFSVDKVPRAVGKPDNIKGRKHGEILWKKESADEILGYREIYDIQSLEKLGELYVLLDETYVRSIYSNLKTTPGSFFVILDEKGELLSSDWESKLDTKELLSLKEGGTFIELLEEKQYVSFDKSSYLNWRIYTVTPQKEMLENVRFVRYLLYALCIIITGVMLMVARIFSRSITKPVHTLIDLTEEVKKGNFEVQMPVESADEFGTLAQSFNSMISQTNTLIEREYKNELLIREAEYKYLQAQINPHFLYNTLDSISWLANISGEKEISRMSVSLGKIMRWAISNTAEVVTLEEELQNLEAYMTIQRIRYSERMVDIEDVPENLRAYYVPKMILQPMVENALIHGLEEKAEGGHIYVIARKIQGELCITIRDDGVGIPEERLEKIRAGKLDTERQKRNVGVDNVNRRIKMLFGQNYGLEIESVYGKGTAVHMYMALIDDPEQLLRKGRAEHV